MWDVVKIAAGIFLANAAPALIVLALFLGVIAIANGLTLVESLWRKLSALLRRKSS